MSQTMECDSEPDPESLSTSDTMEFAGIYT